MTSLEVIVCRLSSIAPIMVPTTARLDALPSYSVSEFWKLGR